MSGGVIVVGWLCFPRWHRCRAFGAVVDRVVDGPRSLALPCRHFLSPL